MITGYFRASPVPAGVAPHDVSFSFDERDLHSVAAAWRAALAVVEEHGGRVVVCNAPSVEGPWSGALAVGDVAEPPPRRPRARSGVHRVPDALAEVRDRLRGMRGMKDNDA